MALTPTDITNAELDLQSLADVINGSSAPAMVTTRLGQNIHTLAYAIEVLVAYFNGAITFNELDVLVEKHKIGRLLIRNEADTATWLQIEAAAANLFMSLSVVGALIVTNEITSTGFGSTVVFRGSSGGAGSTVGCRIEDSDASHTGKLEIGQDFTSNRRIIFIPPNANSTINWSASGSLTFSAFGGSIVNLADAAAGRTLFALGSISIQAASAVAITGGTISGLSSLAANYVHVVGGLGAFANGGINLYYAGGVGWISASSSSGGTLVPVGIVSTLAPQGLLDISGASAGQVKFPATQNPSSNANTLDDYEEGTWTPVLQFDAETTGITYTSRGGTYTKVGNRVIGDATIVLSNKGSSVGQLLITGLPFAPSAGVNAVSCVVQSVSGLSDARAVMSSGNYVAFYTGSGAGLAVATNANCTNTTEIYISFEYQTT